MKKKNNIETQLKNIHSIMEKLDSSERELLSDKLISYLLFDSQTEKKNQKKNSPVRKKSKEASGLTKEEINALKKLAKKTEDLRNLLGDEPGFFM